MDEYEANLRNEWADLCDRTRRAQDLVARAIRVVLELREQQRLGKGGTLAAEDEAFTRAFEEYKAALLAEAAFVDKHFPGTRIQ